MPNEKITGNPAEKPAEKVSENGRGNLPGVVTDGRGRPQGGRKTDRRANAKADSRPARRGDARNVQPDKPQGGSQSGRPAGSSGRSGSSRPVAGTAVGKPAFNWTWRDYALQLSVVIIGIVVTFAGSGLISRWASQRQVRTVMQLVVSELEQNREMLRDVYSNLDYDRRGMLMFMEYDELEDIPADSLAHYSLLLSYLPSYRPQQEALEVLKSSDIVSAVGDKQFLADIFGCYNRLNDFRENVCYVFRAETGCAKPPVCQYSRFFARSHGNIRVVEDNF